MATPANTTAPLMIAERINRLPELSMDDLSDIFGQLDIDVGPLLLDPIGPVRALPLVVFAGPSALGIAHQPMHQHKVSGRCVRQVVRADTEL